MDKGRIFKIIQISFLCFFTTGKHIFAEESSQHEENFETGEDEEDDEDDEEEEEKEFEPLRKLPDAQPICPNLDRALDASMNKYKVKKIKVDDSFLKNLNFGIEMASLGKNLWFVTAQRKSKHRDYNFDYHGRVGTVWKHNFYLGGDFGFSTGKDCIWEDSDKKEEENKKLDTKYAHLSKGFYVNALIGYNYRFDGNNDVIFAAKFGSAWATIEKLKDQTFFEGEKNEFQPYWVGLLLAFENKLFSSPIFWGGDLQMNYLLDKKKIDNLQNYFIPDYGHSNYELNFGFNLFLGLKINFEDEIIVP